MGKEQMSRDTGAWIENIIRDFIANSPRNTMQDESNEAAWDDVLGGRRSGSRTAGATSTHPRNGPG